MFIKSIYLSQNKIICCLNKKLESIKPGEIFVIDGGKYRFFLDLPTDGKVKSLVVVLPNHKMTVAELNWGMPNLAREGIAVLRVAGPDSQNIDGNIERLPSYPDYYLTEILNWIFSRQEYRDNGFKEKTGIEPEKTYIIPFCRYTIAFGKEIPKIKKSGLSVIYFSPNSPSDMLKYVYGNEKLDGYVRILLSSIKKNNLYIIRNLFLKMPFIILNLLQKRLHKIRELIEKVIAESNIKKHEIRKIRLGVDIIDLRALLLSLLPLRLILEALFINNPEISFRFDFLDFREILQNSQDIPTMIIHASEDEYVKEKTIAKLVLANPDVKLNVIPNADHKFSDWRALKEAIQTMADYILKQEGLSDIMRISAAEILIKTLLDKLAYLEVMSKLKKQDFKMSFNTKYLEKLFLWLVMEKELKYLFNIDARKNVLKGIDQKIWQEAIKNLSEAQDFKDALRQQIKDDPILKQDFYNLTGINDEWFNAN